MYLSCHPERKFYLMFPMKDGIKRCLYRKQLVNCIFLIGFNVIVETFVLNGELNEMAVLTHSYHKMALLSHARLPELCCSLSRTEIKRWTKNNVCLIKI